LAGGFRIAGRFLFPAPMWDKMASCPTIITSRFWESAFPKANIRRYNSTQLTEVKSTETAIYLGLREWHANWLKAMGNWQSSSSE
jgi:hypothetical protein